jgi:hypothetical protein
MAKTLADLRARVLIKVGLPSDDAMAPTATLDVCINNGLNKMAADYDWPHLITSETITTVVGTAGYNLPAGHIRTLYIQDTTRGLNFEGRQRQDLIQYSVTGKTGMSRFYSVVGSTVQLAPAPDTVWALNHVYIRAEPALSNTTDSPLCPEHYSDVIVCYAASEFCILNKDPSQKGTIDQEIAQWIRRMRDNVHQSAFTMRPRVRQDW